AVQTAKERLSACDYEGAIHALERVPAALRNHGAAVLLEEAACKAREVASLSSQLREAVQEKRADQLLPRVVRLLALKPDHDQAQRLAERLRRHFCEAARKKLAQHHYDAALHCLEQIPEPISDPGVDTLREQAGELAWLSWGLKNAPVVDKTLLSLGERLVHLSPDDPQPRKLLAELQRRSALPLSDSRSAVVPWAAAPETMHVGLPVDWITGFQRIRFSENFDPGLLVEHPGCFFVAAGLALQGLGLAEVKTDLLRRDRSTLGRVGRWMRMRPARSAWGIDLSSAGLKAVRLAFGARDEQIVIDACDYVEHKKPLGHAVNEGEERAMIEETVRKFLGRNQVNADCRWLGLPGRMVFNRQFPMPIMDAAKLPAAVEYEAKRSVPFSLDDLAWDYAVVDYRNETSPRVDQQVLLIAVKRIPLKERLASLQHAGLKIDGVQSDSLALGNWIAFDRLHDEENTEGRPRAPGTATAILDIGSDTTSMVILGPGALGLYASGLGGDNFTKSLVRQFQLTFAQAEALKRDFSTAPSLGRLQKAIDPVFEALVDEIRRVVAAFRKSHPHLTIGRILCVGGGLRTHGLLRYLKLGK
ncbi:MAG: pilus assembly protein PilM, partial [Pirellulales bacterium]|nr:pilus assembly protein PilM [Pirellulales bacterium]